MRGSEPRYVARVVDNLKNDGSGGVSLRPAVRDAARAADKVLAGRAKTRALLTSIDPVGAARRLYRRRLSRPFRIGISPRRRSRVLSMNHCEPLLRPPPWRSVGVPPLVFRAVCTTPSMEGQSYERSGFCRRADAVMCGSAARRRSFRNECAQRGKGASNGRKHGNGTAALPSWPRRQLQSQRSCLHQERASGRFRISQRERDAAPVPGSIPDRRGCLLHHYGGVRL